MIVSFNGNSAMAVNTFATFKITTPTRIRIGTRDESDVVKIEKGPATGMPNVYTLAILKLE
ncbi:MAG: hypothetical protein C4K58_05730 [Flavobacteriaceae bacterium]|nr:MAG: hypothetical protein C4K58_05730 [Flavobacteriaceae bacterium]